MNEHIRSIREEAMALAPADPPPPWHQNAFVHAGGAIAVGWTAAEHVLVVSHDGYSISDSLTGERVIRDRDAAMAYQALQGLTFTVPTTHEIVQVFGINGGGGLLVADDWRLELIAPEWPEQRVVLREPSSVHGPARRAYFQGAHWVDARGLAGTLLGCGFAPSGHLFLVAASDGVIVYARPASPKASSLASASPS